MRHKYEMDVTFKPGKVGSDLSSHKRNDSGWFMYAGACDLLALRQPGWR